MVINSCGFGNIVIDGHKYTSDLIIFPDGHIKDTWRRKSGHRLAIGDINDLISTKPEIIIAGTGLHGLMKPETDLEDWLSQNNIKLVAESNKKAADLYNETWGSKSMGACFHLTC